MKKRIFSKTETEQIIDLYINGWKMNEIGKKFACKPEKISEVLRNNDVQIKKNRTTNRLLNEDYFNSIDSPTKAYFLGLLFTDGSVCNDRKRQTNISIGLQESDKAILERLKKELNSGSALNYSKRKGKNGEFNFSVRSNKIANDLAKYNIIPNKTYLIDNLILPVGYEKDFIRGFIDGDGSIYFSANRWHVNITSHSKQILEQIRNICDAWIKKNNHNTVTECNDVYKITWNGIYAQQLLKVLYYNNCCSIARKARLATMAIEDK